MNGRMFEYMDCLYALYHGISEPRLTFYKFLQYKIHAQYHHTKEINIFLYMVGIIAKKAALRVFTYMMNIKFRKKNLKQKIFFKIFLY